MLNHPVESHTEQDIFQVATSSI